MENEMVEKVASGMLGCPVQNLPNKEDRAYWRRNARAAIEAMREPTEAMISSAYDLDYIGGSSERASAGDHWAAMIDAALSPPSLPAHKE